MNDENAKQQYKKIIDREHGKQEAICQTNRLK